ncbi:MAG: hypothetical protein J0G30_06190 [Actinomycetales bacterium]|nr:hypothetical protein [Actinomycetales bacterium]
MAAARDSGPAEPDDDLDALTWAGDEDRARRGVRTAREERAGRFAAEESDRPDDDDLDDDDEPEPADADADAAAPDRTGGPRDAQHDPGALAAAAAPAGAASRALTIASALVYLALTVGWILAVQLTSGGTDVLSALLWQFGEFLAIAAPPLWFVAVRVLVPPGRLGVRVAWLLLGAGLLLPWPLLPVVLP